MNKKKVFQIILFSCILLFLSLNFICAINEQEKEVSKNEVVALESPNSATENGPTEKELEKIKEELRRQRQQTEPKKDAELAQPQEQKPVQENKSTPPPEPIKPPADKINDYELLPKEPKDDIVLPEITNSEVEEFESITPSLEKEKKSYLLRGIISMLLVIAGASMIVIVAASEIKKKKIKKRTFKRIKAKK